jgi:putative ABC transport system permease protein
MLYYYLALGLRSLRRNPALTTLMILLIAVGVASSMVTFAALRVVSGDPMLGKSSRLFVPQLGNRAPADRAADGDPPGSLSYIDAVALLGAHRAYRQAAMYPVNLSLEPGNAAREPFTVAGYAVTADFFPMFEVTFDHGGSWNVLDDQRGGSAVVISRKLNQRLFGGTNSVGLSLKLGGHDYRVAGITGDWNPQPHFYAGEDINDASYRGDPPDVYLPFSRAIDLQVATAGNDDCARGYNNADWGARLRSECDWITVWVELHGATQGSTYRRFLEGYAAEQQHNGRWPWPPNVRLRDMTEWLVHERAVPEEARLSFMLAVGLQVVCLVNVIGLLLAKFMCRRVEIGVRRALGASRRTIYAQFLTEGAMVGLAGGALGLLATAAGIFEIGRVFQPKIARLVHVDVSLLGLTLLVSVVATVLAALYPTWRAAQVQPAWQLKSQ